MAFVALEIPPGNVIRGTQYESKGRWRISDLVRWFEGIMGPIGGWVQRSTSAMTGVCRQMVAWRDATTIRWLACATHSKLYAFSQTSTVPADITPAGFVAGNADASASAGYGVGLYGAGTYGTPRTDTVSVQEAAMWSLDIWGAAGDLLACAAQDGLIYRWQRDVLNVAAALGGAAPTGNQGIVVTPEGFLFALGAGNDQRKVQWPDQGSLTDWTPTALNQAGDNELQTQGAVKRGIALRTQTLIFTDVDVHVATYIGLPIVYRFDRAGENCGIISRGAVATSGSYAFWMGLNGFFVFDGGSVSEIPCAVWDYVFGDLNTAQRSKVTARINGKFSEVWWRYPSAASTEVDRAVVYNYQEQTWTIHPSIPRTAGVDAGIFTNPIEADSSGNLYDHETGYLYGGATPYAESGPMEIADGERLAKVIELIPDEKTQGDVVVRFYARDWPNGAETTYGPYTMGAPTNIRMAARQAKMRVTGNVATNWRWGTPRLNVIQGGRR